MEKKKEAESLAESELCLDCGSNSQCNHKIPKRKSVKEEPVDEEVKQLREIYREDDKESKYVAGNGFAGKLPQDSAHILCSDPELLEWLV